MVIVNHFRRDRGALALAERLAAPLADLLGWHSDFDRRRVLGEPRIGAHGTPIFFVHPRDMGGVLTEIMETPKGAH